MHQSECQGSYGLDLQLSFNNQWIRLPAAPHPSPLRLTITITRLGSHSHDLFVFHRVHTCDHHQSLALSPIKILTVSKKTFHLDNNWHYWIHQENHLFNVWTHQNFRMSILKFAIMSGWAGDLWAGWRATMDWLGRPDRGWDSTLGWGWRSEPSPGQARPTRLRGQTQPRASGQGPPGSNVSLSHPMASAPASCSRKYGHTQASHWSDSTFPGLWLADEDHARPPGPLYQCSLCHLGVARVSVTLTHVSRQSRAPEAGCDVLWRSRHSLERDVTTQQLPSRLLWLRMVIITNYPGSGAPSSSPEAIRHLRAVQATHFSIRPDILSAKYNTIPIWYPPTLNEAKTNMKMGWYYLVTIKETASKILKNGIGIEI